MARRTTQRDLAGRVSQWEARKIVEGQRAYEAGDKVRAARIFDKILSRNKRCWPAVFSLAVIAHTICDHDYAVGMLTYLCTEEPGFAEAWYNLGTIEQCINRYADAADHLRKAIELDPTLVNARINLGNALLGLGRTEEAHAEYTAALQYKPNNAEATWNLSHYYILTGQWLKGWACYEARWSIPGFTEMNAIHVLDGPTVPIPWQGEDLTGKTLLVAEEQGYGDWWLSIRYADRLRELGATVTWACRPESIRLTARSVAPDRVVSIRDDVPSADYIVTCMTLHHRLAITPTTVPYPGGYLKAA
jgi:tetratricopeptide (TPR) repeat protein